MKDTEVYWVWQCSTRRSEVVYRGSEIESAKMAWTAIDQEGYAYATKNGQRSAYLTQFLRNYLGASA
jgi:hypothetical protein